MSAGLPIDEVLPEIAQLCASSSALLVVEAPPGAGKTTRLPARLLNQPWLKDKRVVVAQPRRIAARLAAQRASWEVNCKLGDRVGYRVRLDERYSARTRLLYETQGLVLRRMLDPAGLQGVGCLILDEIHERSAELDLCLALLDEVFERHPELRVVAMSATLDADAFVEHFPGARRIRSAGRAYPVEISHAPKPDDRPLEIQVRAALANLKTERGDVLVFLPGAREIRRCQKALQDSSGCDILPLHGDLPLVEQARVVQASPGDAQRIVLSTNIAETSLTLPRIGVVIDSGLARVAHHDPFSGVSVLETEPISQARAIQRSGRAGRIQAGRCLRLYTKGQYQARPAQDDPEILRTDLSSVMLLAFSSGRDPRALRWLTPAKESSWRSAEVQLTALGAIEHGRLLPTGREMARLPLPPRLARILIEGAVRGIGPHAALAAALLSERDILQAGRSASKRDVAFADSDLDLRLELFEQAQAVGFDSRRVRELGLEPQAIRRVAAVAKQLSAKISRSTADGAVSSVGDPLLPCLLAGLPDRVAQRKPGRKLLLSTGLSARLADTSAVGNAALLLALRAAAVHSREATVHMAVRLEADWLLEYRPGDVVATDELDYDTNTERVEQISRLRYGKLTLEESRSPALPSPEVARLLAKAAEAKGPAVYDPEDQLANLAERLKLLAAHMSDWVDELSAEQRKLFLELSESTESLRRFALETACLGTTRLHDLRSTDWQSIVLGSLADVAYTLTRELPTTIRLPSGRQLTVHYEAHRDPWIQSRLQDFFSVATTPTVCAGRVPLLVHLLAPNRRAVQVTRDLESFWKQHYPELRKQLMRRYPKHAWPEDGLRASPPPPGRLR